MKKISDILRDYQNKNSLTQHQMAAFLGIAQSTYNNWVNERVIVNPVKYYKKIAALCEIELELIIPKNAKWILLQSQDASGLNSKLDDCLKYVKNIEELNFFLRKEIEHLLTELNEKELLIKKLQID
jgi:transcriptional regulator with XRE-family HTH domain